MVHDNLPTGSALTSVTEIHCRQLQKRSKRIFFIAVIENYENLSSRNIMKLNHQIECSFASLCALAFHFYELCIAALALCVEVLVRRQQRRWVKTKGKSEATWWAKELDNRRLLKLSVDPQHHLNHLTRGLIPHSHARIQNKLCGSMWT